MEQPIRLEQNYQRFREIYGQQDGLIPIEVLRELDSMQFGRQQMPERIYSPDEGLENRMRWIQAVGERYLCVDLHNLVTCEAFAAAAMPEFINSSIRLVGSSPQRIEEMGLYEEAAQACRWMESNPGRYSMLGDRLVSVSLQLQDIRMAIPENPVIAVSNHGHPSAFLERIYPHLFIEDFVSEALMNMEIASDRIRGCNAVHRAYVALGRLGE